MQDDATTGSPHPLLILKTGDTFDALRAAQGDFEHWIADGLGDAGLPLLVLDPRRGDALPAATEICGVVLTGSHSMVSHREEWSEQAAAWLAELVQQDAVPVLGICYGHQLLAHALGGEAGDHPVAMELGTVQVQATQAAAHDPLFRGLPSRTWGVQFHPEFDERAMRGYIDRLATDVDSLAAVRDAVRPTPEAASILQRFARLVAQRAAAAAPAALN